MRCLVCHQVVCLAEDFVGAPWDSARFARRWSGQPTSAWSQIREAWPPRTRSMRGSSWPRCARGTRCVATGIGRSGL